LTADNLVYIGIIAFGFCYSFAPFNWIEAKGAKKAEEIFIKSIISPMNDE